MEGTTSLWWDMESCPLPSYVDPYIVASMRPALLRNFNISNSMVNAGGCCSSLDHHHFSAYELFSETQTELHQTLINSGIGLHQLPPGKSSKEMEKMMMADVLLWAMDTPPPANIIFILGNLDFCYVIQKLRERSYNVFLVCQSMSEMPRGMLGGVNNCLGWLSFIRTLQIEDQHSHFPGGISVYDHTFSNTAVPAPSTSIYNREMEEWNNASGFNYSQENLFSPKPSLGDEWGSTGIFPSTLSDGLDSKCNFPLNETASNQVQPEPPFHDHSIRTKKPMSPASVPKPSLGDEWGSTGNFPSTLSDGWDSTCNFPLNETASNPVQPEPRFHDHSIRTKKPMSPASVPKPSLGDEWGSTGNFPSTLSDGWDSTCNFPLNETASNPMQPEPRFHGHSIRTKKPMSPASSASSTEKKKPASLEEFKEWLTLVVNGKKHAEEGYNISPVRMDFEKATGKILDEKLLGFLKIINLVEYCKDVVVIKEVKRGCHLAFPVKPNERANRMPLLPLPGGRNSYPNKNFQSKDKPRSESKPIPKRKASAEDFRKCIYHMRQAGEFSQGFLMARLPQRFEQRTRKFLDVEHLGYKRMSELVASCSDLVSVHNVGPGPVRIFPAGSVPNLYPNSNTYMDRPSSGGSGKELIENSGWEENISYEHTPYMNYESQWPPVTFGSLESASFNPIEANAPAFQEYSIKSDSSSPPGGSQVSEWEGQSSNAIGETMSFHLGFEGSDFIKQYDSPLQWESNDPIEESVNAERLMAEAMQNMSLLKENTIFCEEPCIPAGTILPDSFPPPSDSPSSEPQTGGCNSPLAPLQCKADSFPPLSDSPSSEPQTGGCNSPLARLQCKAESNAVCAEDLTHRIILDCKQKEQNSSSTGNEEKIASAVSSAGSIIQVAGRGLKSICELKIWRKN